MTASLCFQLVRNTQRALFACSFCHARPWTGYDLSATAFITENTGVDGTCDICWNHGNQLPRPDCAARRADTHLLHQIDSGELEEWKHHPAPAIARNYWKMPRDATLRDVRPRPLSAGSAMAFRVHPQKFSDKGSPVWRLRTQPWPVRLYCVCVLPATRVLGRPKTLRVHHAQPL